MRGTQLVREAVAAALAGRVSTALVALLSMAVCLTAFLTVGRSAAAEVQILARLDSAGSRLTVLADKSSDSLLAPSIITAIGNLSTVERAVGTTTPVDVTFGWTGLTGTKVVSWNLIGRPGDAVTLLAGRWPGPGEAIISTRAAQTFGLDGPAGYVNHDIDELPVVGIYQAREPFEDLDAGCLTIPSEATLPANSVRIIAQTYRDSAQVLAAAIDIIRPASGLDLTISSPEVLAEAQAQVQADLGVLGRGLLLLVLAAGGGLTALVVLADTLIRRVDLGRRRALGISRGDLVALTVTRTVLAATLGVAVAVATCAILAARQANLPGWDFIGGTAILAIVAAGLAAIPPALVAALIDPVRVLRTP